MNAFKAGLLAGALLGSATAATVFAQFGATSNSPPEAMNSAERHEVLARCDGVPIGPAKDRCMDDLLVNRNAAPANGGAGRGTASRAGDGRTGAPGIGTGSASVTGEGREAGQGARTNSVRP